MATICLNMIVKNESKVIERCLRSAKPIIDHWVIVDTGSTDGTQDLIRSTLSDVPGTLIEEKWVNFGFNRTSALTHAKGTADYILLIDADMELVVDPKFEKNTLDLERYYTKGEGDITYERTLLVRSDLNWQYFGVTHEWVGKPDLGIADAIHGIRLLDHFDGGSRTDKYERDIRLLSAALGENPDDTRSMFYLAQSYRDVGDFPNAIKWYEKRASAGNWEEEIWYSVYQIARLKEMIGTSPHQLFYAYLKAWELRPWRAEPLYELARYCRLHGDRHLAYLFAQKSCVIKFPANDRLFVHNIVYDFHRWDELVVCGYDVGAHWECFKVANRLIRSSHVPRSELLRVRVNRDWHASRLDYAETVAGEIALCLDHRDQYELVSNLSNFLEDRRFKVHLIINSITPLDDSHKKIIAGSLCAFVWKGGESHKVLDWCVESGIPAFTIGHAPIPDAFVLNDGGTIPAGETALTRWIDPLLATVPVSRDEW